MRRINAVDILENPIENYAELREAMENPLLFHAKPFNFKSIEFAFEFFGIFVSLLDKVLKIYKYIKKHYVSNQQEYHDFIALKEVVSEAKTVFNSLKSGFELEERFDDNSSQTSHSTNRSVALPPTAPPTRRW